MLLLLLLWLRPLLQRRHLTRTLLLDCFPACLLTWRKVWVGCLVLVHSRDPSLMLLHPPSIVGSPCKSLLPMILPAAMLLLLLLLLLDNFISQPRIARTEVGKVRGVARCLAERAVVT